MFEKFTVDAVAAALSEVQGAAPSPRLVHRFFRKGRRDGRRDHDFATSKRFVEEAVEIATSKLAEEYLNERQALVNRLSGLGAEIDNLTSDNTNQSTVEEDLAAEGDGSSEAESGSHAATGGPSMSASLKALEASRKRKKQEADEAARRQREQQRQQLQQTLATTKTEASELPIRYRQMIDSVHHTGSLFWARYCNGYVIGKSKRGAPDAGDPAPEASIEFEMPGVLVDHGDHAKDAPVDKMSPDSEEGPS